MKASDFGFPRFGNSVDGLLVVHLAFKDPCSHKDCFYVELLEDHDALEGYTGFFVRAWDDVCLLPPGISLEDADAMLQATVDADRESKEEPADAGS